MNWKSINRPVYFALLMLSIAFIYLMKWVNGTYLPLLEDRPGFDFHDPVLAAISARDVSGWIFFTLYSSLLLGLAMLARDPKRLLEYFTAMGLMYAFRFVCISCVPLNAPDGLVVLHDPVVDMLGFQEEFLRRDLFFSGHFSTVFLLFLAMGQSRLRWAFLLSSGAMGWLVCMQHIHYSCDVFGGVVFSWAAIWLARRAAGFLMKSIKRTGGGELAAGWVREKDFS